MATSVLWARSYRRWDLWRLHPSPTRYYTLVYESGRVTLGGMTYHRPTWDEALWGRGWNRLTHGSAPLPPMQPQNFWNRQGFYWVGDSNQRPDAREWFATVPAWLPVALTAPLPAAWVVLRLRRRSRRDRGHCAACGYDLTGNVSGTCPECGAAVATPRSG